MNASHEIPGKSVRLRRGILGIVLALVIAGFSLKVAPAKTPSLKVPSVLKGDFTYIENDKGNNKNFDWDRNDQVDLNNIECRLVTAASATADIAQYLITKLTWHAVGRGREISLSNQGCTYKADENAEGSGTEAASFPMSIPGGLIWYPKEKRFELTFATNADKGHWRKVYHPCHPGDTQETELTKSWDVVIKGDVLYNPKTKTYQFGAFSIYKKPVEPGGESNVMVQVQGSMMGSVK